MWYHTLNCGFRTRDQRRDRLPLHLRRAGRPGPLLREAGRQARLRRAGARASAQGRNYVSDGRSHLMDFKVERRRAWARTAASCSSTQPGTVHVTREGRRAARPRQPDDAIREPPVRPAALLAPRARPHRRHARGAGRGHRQRLSGRPAERSSPTARCSDVAFDVKIERSSWVALRILPSSHTNPVFVLVGDKPIRASRRSAEWCLKGVDQCWSQKQRFIAAAEMDDAKAAYDHARRGVPEVLAECDAD